MTAVRYRCTNEECVSPERTFVDAALCTFDWEAAGLTGWGVTSGLYHPDEGGLPCGPAEEIIGPARVRLRRVPGWRIPPGCVKVDRTTRYGNPFEVHQNRGGDGRFYVEHPDTEDYLYFDTAEAAALCAVFGLFEPRLLAGQLEVTADDVRRDLAGRDIGCWCRNGAPCHGDVLLRVANP